MTVAGFLCFLVLLVIVRIVATTSIPQRQEEEEQVRAESVPTRWRWYTALVFGKGMRVDGEQMGSPLCLPCAKTHVAALVFDIEDAGPYSCSVCHRLYQPAGVSGEPVTGELMQ